MNDQQELDDSMIARFTDLRFPQGTRLKMVRLQFAVEIQFSTLSGAFSKCILETKEPSNPFVVMTNENQWDQSEGMLLKKDIFDGNVDSSWCMVCSLSSFTIPLLLPLLPFFIIVIIIIMHATFYDFIANM